MRPTVSQYAQALEELSGDAGATRDIAQNLLGFLKRRGESEKLAAIVEQLEWRFLKQAGKLPVTVTTAHALADETKRSLVKQAEGIFPGKTITLSYEIDSAVIGGARFRTDETLYDATFRARLAALKNSLHKS